MKILIVGGGGREHALAWKIVQSPLVSKVFCAPGNPGIGRIAQCVPISSDNLEELAEFAALEHIDLTVVGPEAPLTAGIVDVFESRGLKIFGPSPDPARIEGSKVFAKKMMQTSGIPTADFWVCDSLTVARARIADYYAAQGRDSKIVIKADGLAAGKGVVVASTPEEAEEALQKFMSDRIFGAAGDVVVIEECLIGEEASIIAITDGETVRPFIPSQDHKRVFDGDQGPNTGGMGAYAPVPFIPQETIDEAVERVLKPAISAIRSLGIPYRGFIYAGIMLTAEGIKTIEFNCRLGDPETQTILPLLESDLVPILIRASESTLDQAEIKWRKAASVCVTAASGGYPGIFQSGKVISGLDQASEREGCVVFHAGTKEKDGQLLTAGGRVLSVTAIGDDLEQASKQAYGAMSDITFEGMHYRKDIGARAIKIPVMPTLSEVEPT